MSSNGYGNQWKYMITHSKEALIHSETKKNDKVIGNIKKY